MVNFSFRTHTHTLEQFSPKKQNIKPNDSNSLYRRCFEPNILRALWDFARMFLCWTRQPFKCELEGGEGIPQGKSYRHCYWPYWWTICVDLYCLGYVDDLTMVVRGKFGSTLSGRSQMALKIVENWCKDETQIRQWSFHLLGKGSTKGWNHW